MKERFALRLLSEHFADKEILFHLLLEPMSRLTSPAKLTEGEHRLIVLTCPEQASARHSGFYLRELEPDSTVRQPESQEAPSLRRARVSSLVVA